MWRRSVISPYLSSDGVRVRNSHLRVWKARSRADVHQTLSGAVPDSFRDAAPSPCCQSGVTVKPEDAFALSQKEPVPHWVNYVACSITTANFPLVSTHLRYGGRYIQCGLCLCSAREGEV